MERKQSKTPRVKTEMFGSIIYRTINCPSYYKSLIVSLIRKVLSFRKHKTKVFLNKYAKPTNLVLYLTI